MGAEDKRILAMSDMFSQIWFHEKVNVEGGLIEALESYHRKEHRLGGYVENKIVHDWSSHISVTHSPIGLRLSRTGWCQSFRHSRVADHP
jgi:hypothetical protein